MGKIIQVPHKRSKVRKGKSMSGLPVELKKYFWDCDFSQLNMQQHAFFIAERVLRFGNMRSLTWLLGILSNKFLRQVLQKSRNLDKKTVNFWQVMLNAK